MQLGWNPHQVRRREHFRRFAATAIAPGSATRDREGTFDRQIWKELAADNFWTGHIPRRYGGEGGDMWDFLAGFEGLALGADDCGFVLSAVAHAGLIQVLLDHGTPDQRGDLLPGLMNGQIGATAATEPAGGSHVAAIATSAVAAGDGYLLSGHKAHITNAPVADTILIVGRVPELGKRDITLFIVDAADAGVTTGQPEDLLGQRTSPTGSISLDHVTVPADRVIGAVGDGLTTLYSFLAFDRLMYGIVAATKLEAMIAHAMWGNDGLDVLSTPAILGHMERLCVDTLAAHLSPGDMTVGTRVQMRHLAPTNLGENVTFQVTADRLNRNITVSFQVTDADGRLLSDGTHQRWSSTRRPSGPAFPWRPPIAGAHHDPGLAGRPVPRIRT